ESFLSDFSLNTTARRRVPECCPAALIRDTWQWERYSPLPLSVPNGNLSRQLRPFIMSFVPSATASKRRVRLIRASGCDVLTGPVLARRRRFTSIRSSLAFCSPTKQLYRLI